MPMFRRINIQVVNINNEHVFTYIIDVGVGEKGKFKMTENLDIPKELEILNPEWQAKPILIGMKVHTLYPLTEGQAEKLSKTISGIIHDIYTTDMQCPRCNAVYKDALGNFSMCKKPKCKGLLEAQQKEVIEAILGGGRLKKVLAELLDIQEEDVAESTIPQLKYIAGLLYAQNFSEDSVPEGSEKNFQELLTWMGMGTEERMSAPLEQSMNILPENTDLPENILEENGKMVNLSDSPDPS